MKNNPKKNILLISSTIILVLLGALTILIITQKPTPVALLMNYDLKTVWDEAQTMNECAECHNSETFHSCNTCHDDHGAIELTNISFYAVVDFTGDVPEPAFIRINHILPNQNDLGTHLSIFDFLSEQGVEKFESITFITNDGGLSTIAYENLDETSLLVPYQDGVRFVTESVHYSTWLKGITRIIVVGQEKPLLIDGVPTSIGRLLIGDCIQLTVEGSEVFLTGEDGETREAFVANRVEGAPLLDLLSNPSPEIVTVTNSQDKSWTFSVAELTSAILSMNRGKVTLILPDRGRVVWPTDIVRIESQ